MCTPQSFMEDEGLARLAHTVQVLVDSTTAAHAERSHQGAALLGALSSSVASTVK